MAATKEFLTTKSQVFAHAVLFGIVRDAMVRVFKQTSPKMDRIIFNHLSTALQHKAEAK